MIHNVRAVTLWYRRSGEADKVVGLFCAGNGTRYRSRGEPAKSTAKFGALTEPFVESEIALYLVPGRRVSKVVGGKMILKLSLFADTGGAIRGGVMRMYFVQLRIALFDYPLRKFFL
jgi:hypothetical protein